jgi:hypothetical protein
VTPNWPLRRQYCRGVSNLLGAFLWLAGNCSEAREAQRPSFTMPTSSATSEDKSRNRKDLRDTAEVRKEDRWYLPELAFGVGLGIPEIIPLEGYAFFGRHLAIRAFFTPSLPFNIRVEVPSDVISAKQGLAVANPDFTAQFKGSYGATYGASLLYFPFGGSFFVGGGISQRRLKLAGDASAPVLVCSIIEAAKEPPCGDPSARIETKTRLALEADVSTTSLINTIETGWFARIGGSGYLTARFGFALPWGINRTSTINATLDGPSSTPDDISGALADIRTEKEAEMRKKVLQEIRPLDEKGLPIVAFGAGIRL